MLTTPNRSARGFTLVEIASVLAIIGVLTTIAVLGGRLFTERAREGAMMSELDNIWEESRSLANAQDIGVRAALQTVVAAANTRSGYTVEPVALDASGDYLAVTDRSATHVRITLPSTDDLPCAVMAVAPDPTVEQSAVGPCDGPTTDAMRRLRPGGWWPFDDATGATTLAAEFGAPASPAGTLEQGPAAAGDYDADRPPGPTPDGFTGINVPSAIRTGEGAVNLSAAAVSTIDDDGYTNPTDGLTVAAFVRYPSGDPGTGTAMQIGDGSDTLITLGFTTDVPTCTLGDPTGTDSIQAIPRDASNPTGRTWDNLLDEPADWHLLACRYNPDDVTVSVVIDGVEVARSARPDRSATLEEFVPAWWAGGQISPPLPVAVYPAGGPLGSAAGFYDEPAVYGAALADGSLASLYALTRVPDCPIETGCP